MTELSRAIVAVTARLTEAAKGGGILDGWKVVTVPRTDTEPVNILPAVRMQGVSFEDLMVARASGSAQVTIAIEVAVLRSEGVGGLADGLAKVLDAIETDAETEEVDGSLDSSTLNGMTAKTEGSGVSANALWTIVTLTVGTRPFMRGNRRGEA